MSDQACCSHLRVYYNPVRRHNGTVSPRWLCDDCDHRFVPKTQVAQVEHERDEARAEVARRCDQVDALQHERDKVMVALGGGYEPSRIVERIDALKAEVERLRAALDEVGRGGPVWMNDRDGATVIRSMHAKIKEGVAEIQRLRGELDRLKSTMHFMGEPFDAWFKALDLCWKRTDLMGTESITKLAAKYDALRAAPPVVNVTDIEAAVRLLTATDGSLNAMKLTPDGLRYTLRACTRPLDREGLARLLYERVERSPWLEYHTWETLPETVRPGWIARADAVLRYLGAQPNAVPDPDDRERPLPGAQPGPRAVTNYEEPWTDQDRKHGRHVVLCGVAGFQGPDQERHWIKAAQPVEPVKCSRCGGSGWVWRHELDTPIDPSDPSPDDTRYSCPDCQREEPKPPEPKIVGHRLDRLTLAEKPAWTENDTIRALTDAMREADEVFERVGGSTRRHVRDCLLPVLEKHGIAVVPVTAPKVRVKLPTESIFHASDGEALLRRSVVVVLLREQGVEVDE